MKLRSPIPKTATRREFDASDENALEVFVPDPNAVYSLKAVAAMLDVPRRSILVYCKHGFIMPVTEPSRRGYYFDQEAIRAIRSIEALRHMMGDELAMIGMVLDLMRRLEYLTAEIRFLRG